MLRSSDICPFYRSNRGANNIMSHPSAAAACIWPCSLPIHRLQHQPLSTSTIRDAFRRMSLSWQVAGSSREQVPCSYSEGWEKMRGEMWSARSSCEIQRMNTRAVRSTTFTFSMLQTEHVVSCTCTSPIHHVRRTCRDMLKREFSEKIRINIIAIIPRKAHNLQWVQFLLLY